MKKNKQNKKETIKILLTIKKIGINGEGIGYYKKKITFVKGALPNEVVFCEIIEETKNYIVAKLLKIKEESNDRVKNIEKHYLESGAYPLIHIKYDKQLEYKRNIVIDAFNKYLNIKNVESIVKNTIPCENTKYYRNKNQYPLAIKDSKVIAGLFKEKSNDLVDIKDDFILCENGNRITNIVKELIFKYRVTVSMSKKVKGLKYIATRTSFFNGKTQVIFIANTKNVENLDKLVEKLKKDKTVVSIVLNITDEKSHLVMGEKNIVLYGDSYIIEKIGDTSYKLSANSFFQLNPYQTKVLYDKVVEVANFSKESFVLDAYCGVGAIGIYASKYCKKIYGVDIVKEAIKNANENIKLNNLENCTYLVGDVTKKVEEFRKNKINFDTIILDPARSGLESLSYELLKLDTKKIVYVSCNPSTLAKDLKILLKKYTLKEVTPIDMFPNAASVETVSVLVKK